MDNYSTPISQLKEQNTPNNITDYSQVLQNLQQPMQQQQQQPMQQQQQQQPIQQQQQPMQYQQMPQEIQYMPPPAMQSLKPQAFPMGFEPKQDPNPPPTISFDNNKEVVIVIALCLILYSNQFQSFFSKIVPALYKDNSLSSVGNIIFPFLIGALFYSSKTYL